MIKYDPTSRIFYSTLINDGKYFSAFGTRELGDGKDVKNISNFLSTNGVNFEKIITLEQIHSANVENYEMISEKDVETIDDTDGVITELDNVVLTVIAADCIPILFADKKRGLIGISHQGWRGSLKRLCVKMIKQLEGMGSKKENVLAALGPGIGECCYDIDNDRYIDFLEEFEGYSDKIFSMRHGKRHLNLMLLNYLLLLDSGVKKENIDFFPFCTHCDRQRFFSARRKKKSNFERQFSLILK